MTFDRFGLAFIQFWFALNLLAVCKILRIPMYACQYLIVRTFLQHAQNMHCGQYRCYLLNSFFCENNNFFSIHKISDFVFLRCRKRVIGSFVWLDNLKIGVDSFSMQNHIMQISPNLFVTHTQAMLFFARSSYCFLSWTQKSGKLTSKIRCFYSFNCNLFKWHFFFRLHILK